MNSSVATRGIVRAEQSSLSGHHIGFLDGIRGGLSLWVFTYHVAVTAGFNTRFIPAGARAVDIFMLLSGLLMVYTFSVGKNNQHNFSGEAIATFLVRRIFRIVPVYYLLLFIAFLFYTKYLEFESEVTAAFPPPWVADISNDPSIHSISVMNIIMHLTFLFGLDPHYASNMPIPDWSLTLEMQFYLIVPFLLILLRKYGLLVPVIALAIINFLALRYIGLYLSPKIGGLWPQPSFLIFKIDCFVVGMLLALYFFDERFNRIEILCLLMLLIFFGQNIIFSLTAILCFAPLGKGGVKSAFFSRSLESDS